MFTKFFDKIPPILKNKYLIAGAIFLVIIVFVDKNNLISQYKLRRQLRQLNHQKEFYRNETVRDSIAYKKLTTDTAEMERVGREKYFMKKDNEDVYIVTPKSSGKN